MAGTLDSKPYGTLDKYRFLAWRLIDSYEDSDTGTPFDYDPGPYDVAYDMYKVLVNVTNVSGAVSGLRMRLNGLTGANYREAHADGTTDTALDHLDLSDIDSPQGYSGEILVWGRDPTGETGDVRIGVGNISSAASGWTAIQIGDYAVAVAQPVDQIRVWATENTVGTIEVYGKNFE